MSIAFHVTLVEICQVEGPAAPDLRVGSRWRTGNLLFQAAEPGESLQGLHEAWALARDGQGRVFLIWRADHPRARGLVIQPLDSRYCYELSPA